MTRFRYAASAVCALYAACAGSTYAQTGSMPMNAASAMSGTSSIGMADKSFVNGAAMGGMTEVELGKLAASKGTSQAVKDFGQRMVDDHTKANEELKSIAGPKGLTPPARLDAMRERGVEKFNTMAPGRAFDKSYHDRMVVDHRNTIALFTRESKSGKDADLKAFATKTLPILKSHLQTLQTMKL